MDLPMWDEAAARAAIAVLAAPAAAGYASVPVRFNADISWHSIA